MKTRLWIAAMLYPVVNAVLFGFGIVPVLSIRSLSEQAGTWMPIVVIASLILAAPISWLIPPRLRLRYWRSAKRTDGPQMTMGRH
jgi:hypothetical protein